ncbi:MAG: hypothetical protein V2A71_00820, partial [Candidatus Eisenbacteria bacterium]
YVSRAAAVVWAVNAWSVRWGVSGMETALVACWTVVALYVFAAELSSPSFRRAPWVLALGILVRPEVVLLPLLCFLFVLLRDVRGLRTQGALRARSLSIAAPVLCVGAAWLTFAYLQFGRMTPNTVAVKAGRFVTGESLTSGTFTIAKILGSTSGIELLLVAAGLAAALRARRFHASLDNVTPVAVAWTLLVPAAYVVRDVQVISRYLVPIIPLVVLYGFVSLQWIVQRQALSARFFRTAVAVACGACVLVNLYVLAFVAYPHTHSFTRDMKASLVHLGQWFARHSPPECSVAIPDIGAFGYYSDRRVVDLGGLVTPEVIPIMKDHDLDQILTGFLFAEVVRPDYVVDRAREPWRLLELPSLRPALRPLITTRVSNLGITRPGAFFYSAYRVDWARVDQPSPGGTR